MNSREHRETEPAAITVMSGRYGYCPNCHALGHIRERRPGGNDHCVNGHTYPSRMAINTPTGEAPAPQSAQDT